MSPGERVAVAGLGRMGLPICARLAAAGFEVTATDLRPQLRTQVEGLGALWAPGIAAATSGARLLITVLPGPSEVAGVIDEVSESLPAGGCWIEMSTATPDLARAIADALGPRGINAVDAPVGGGPDAARAGRLLAFTGGEPSDVDRCRPVLEALAAEIVHVGPGGSGYATKLLVNALWFTHAVASAEALSLGSRLGLQLDVLLGALRRSAADSRFLGEDADALLEGDDLTSFSLARCCEELAAVRGLGSPLDVISAVGGVYEAALERYGDVDGELLGARLAAERLGVVLARASRPDSQTPGPAALG